MLLFILFICVHTMICAISIYHVDAISDVSFHLDV